MKAIVKIIVAVLVLWGFNAYSQGIAHNIALTNTPEGAIAIKCFSQEVYFDNGINVYRKSADESGWTKLTVAPLKKGDYKIPDQVLAGDKMLKRLVDFATKTPHEKIKGIVKISMLIDAIQNNEYARFLGIMYVDASVSKGQSYEYRVTKITATGTEEEVSVSWPFVAGPVKAQEPPQNVEIKKHEKIVDMKWKLEVERYYAVNVYMSMNKDLSDEKLVTSKPLMVTKVKNEKGVMEWPSIFYQKDSLKKGLTYNFRFTTIDFFNQEGIKSQVYVVVPPDETPPPPPQNFKLDVKDFTFTLKWKIKKVPDLKGFDIYRTPSEKIPFQKVNKALLKPTDTIYTDMVYQPGSYYYYVAAIDTAGNIAKATALSKEAFDNVPPAKVTNVIVKTEPGKITMTWDANKEKDLAGYIILAADNLKRGKNHDKAPRYSLMTPHYLTKPEYITAKPKDVKNEFLYKVVAVDTNFNRSIPSEIARIQMPDVTPPGSPFIKEIDINAEGAAQIEFLPDLAPD
ncbi:MAG: fibronectin type III domain-containing protein, partial [Bacteroidia bacterium]